MKLSHLYLEKTSMINLRGVGNLYRARSARMGASNVAQKLEKSAPHAAPSHANAWETQGGNIPYEKANRFSREFHSGSTPAENLVRYANRGRAALRSQGINPVTGEKFRKTGALLEKFAILKKP